MLGSQCNGVVRSQTFRPRQKYKRYGIERTFAAYGIIARQKRNSGTPLNWKSQRPASSMSTGPPQTTLPKLDCGYIHTPRAWNRKLFRMGGRYFMPAFVLFGYQRLLVAIAEGRRSCLQQMEAIGILGYLLG